MEIFVILYHIRNSYLIKLNEAINLGILTDFVLRQVHALNWCMEDSKTRTEILVIFHILIFLELLWN